jgi:2-oxoglutarate dehydrogenase E2 component (dihydrolipoamide succinyltransferase)
MASAAVDVTAPAEESEGTRSRVLRWLKAPGDRVARDEPLIELETDKVTVEIPSPADGVLREIFKQEEDEVAPGDRLGRIDASADQVMTAPVQPAPKQVAAPAAGLLPAGEVATAHAGLLSPAVRRLLAEHRVRSDEISGSGAGGRITADDVLAFVAARSQAGTTRPDAPTPSPAVRAEEAGVRRVPHSALRRRIAEHMVTSLLHTAPHVTTVFEADFTAVLAHRDRHREAYGARGAPLTLTTYVIAACVDAIRAVPETNARWTEDAIEILDRIDIGVGTALAGGALIVPVIRDVAALDLEEIARQLAGLTVRAREERLAPAEVRGGTFTISNHGVSGSLLAAPIVINQPQSAILGVGKLERRPVVIGAGSEERIAIRPRCYLTLTIDHRVMDGQRANAFMEVLVRRLSDWGGDD